MRPHAVDDGRRVASVDPGPQLTSESAKQRLSRSLTRRCRPHRVAVTLEMDRTRLFGAGRDATDLIEPVSRRDTACAANLTAFERRSLELFAAGVPRREIAQLLKRAPKTISNSLTAARDKLGARSLGEAAALIAVEVISQAVNAS